MLWKMNLSFKVLKTVCHRLHINLNKYFKRSLKNKKNCIPALNIFVQKHQWPNIEPQWAPRYGSKILVDQVWHSKELSHGLCNQVHLSVFHVDLIRPCNLPHGAADVSRHMSNSILPEKSRRMVVLFSINLIGLIKTDRRSVSTRISP